MIRLPVADRLYTLAFSADGRQLVATGFDEDSTPFAVWWDWAAGREVRRRGSESLAVSACGGFVSDVAMGAEMAVRVFAAAAEAPHALLPVEPGVGWPAHVVLAGGREVLVGHPAHPGLHRLPGGEEVARLAALSHSQDMGFDAPPSGRWLLSRPPSAVRLWDRANGFSLVRFKSDRIGPRAAVSFDDRLVAVSGPKKQTTTVWELATRQEVLRIPADAQTLAWTPAGTLLVSDGGPVQVWDVAAGREVGRFDPGSPVRAVAASPDGLTAAAATFDGRVGHIVVWDI
jgi:hypothetical protein